MIDIVGFIVFFIVLLAPQALIWSCALSNAITSYVRYVSEGTIDLTQSKFNIEERLSTWWDETDARCYFAALTVLIGVVQLIFLFILTLVYNLRDIETGWLEYVTAPLINLAYKSAGFFGTCTMILFVCFTLHKIIQFTFRIKNRLEIHIKDKDAHKS